MPVSEAETTVPRYTHRCIACNRRIDGRRITQRADQCPGCGRATTTYEGGEVFEIYRSEDDYWIIRDSVTEMVTQGPTKEYALDMFCQAMGYQNKAGGIDIHWIKDVAEEIGAVTKPPTDSTIRSKTWEFDEVVDADITGESDS